MQGLAATHSNKQFHPRLHFLKTSTIQPFGATPPAHNVLRIFIVPTCADVGEEYCAGSRLRAGCSVARAHLIREGLL